MTTLQIKIPPKLFELFMGGEKKRLNLGDFRYRVMRGGRGSGKSYTTATMAAVLGATQKMRILCTREFQNTIKESFHAELKRAISDCPWLSSQYDVGIDYLRHRTNGTEFIFSGLRHNISSIKSMAAIDLAIVEEAETVPHNSWIDFLPTIRAKNSEFWIIYNPRRRDSWVAENFDGDSLPPRTIIADINHDDNPYFPDVLEEQRIHDLEHMDPAMYNHIWLGQYYEQSEAQVFANKYIVKDFKPALRWDGPYYGLDYGFSRDPTAGVKAWVNDNKLYIEHDFSVVGLELDDTAEMVYTSLPDAQRHVIRADNARPESTSYLKRKGLPRIVKCKKGKGSVEDGIQFIKSFEKVIIHPRCTATKKDMDLYSYKVDRLSGDIMSTLVDANNDTIDALRYALEPLMTKSKNTLLSRNLFK